MQTSLDNSLPYKIVLVPTVMGIVSGGFQPSILHECASDAEANAIMLDSILRDYPASIHYTIEKIKWPNLL